MDRALQPYSLSCLLSSTPVPLSTFPGAAILTVFRQEASVSDLGCPSHVDLLPMSKPRSVGQVEPQYSVPTAQVGQLPHMLEFGKGKESRFSLPATWNRAFTAGS